MDLQAAAACLRQGKTVAFPTETVYGLGADARSTEAVDAVFAAKGRPSDNPLIVHIAHRDQLHELVTEVNETAEALMSAFWPGPLTLVLPVRPGAVSPRVTAGLDTVAVRMPDHPVALPLIAAAACPVAAPSANRSGRPSPTLAAHVREDLDGRIGGIVDGGPTGVGVESTVVQASDDGTVTILRPGGITAEQLFAVAARVATDPALLAEGSAGDSTSPAPRSPGMKYTHYAPAGRCAWWRGRPQRWRPGLAPPSPRRRSAESAPRCWHSPSTRSSTAPMPCSRWAAPASCRRLRAGCTPRCAAAMSRAPHILWRKPAHARGWEQPS